MYRSSISFFVQHSLQHETSLVCGAIYAHCIKDKALWQGFESKEKVQEIQSLGFVNLRKCHFVIT